MANHPRVHDPAARRAASGGRIPIAVVVILLVLAVHAAAAGATQRIFTTGGFDGTVYAVTPPDTDGRVVVGGAFRVFDPWDTGAGALVDLTTGLPDSSIPKVGRIGASGGTINAVVGDGAGGYFIGGKFECVGGDGGADGDCVDASEVRRYGLAHLESDGSVDEAWEAGVGSSTVFAMVRVGTTLYVGGGFTRIGGVGYGAGNAGGVARSNLAALDTATGAVLTWNPNANFEVRAMAANAAGTRVYVGGSFTTVGGQSRNRIAELDTAGAATSWNPNANGSVYALAVSGTTVYAGGGFSNIGGQARNRVAAVGGDAAATGWNPNANGDVYAVALSGTTIYIGGSFTTVGGLTRNRIAAISDGGTVSSWDPNASTASSFVYAIAVSGTTAYVGGTFTTIAGQARNRIAAIRADGTATDWNPNLLGSTSASAKALLVNETTNSVYVGGGFGTVGGTVRNRIAQLDANGALTNWNPDADDVVRALVQSGTTLYVGGDFTTIGGQTRNRIAALNADGTATSWNPNASGKVRAIAVSGTTVYAGGEFTTIGGQTRNRIAALNADGTVGDWNPNANGTVNVLATDGTAIYAGGDFGSIGGQTRNRLAALKADGTAYAWDPFTYGTVSALVVDDGTVYVGGAFDTWGGPSPSVWRRNLAAFDTGDCLTTYATADCMKSWNPNANGQVSAMTLIDGTMYVGGAFGCMNGPTLESTTICSDATRNRLAAVRTGACVASYTSDCVTEWNPNVGTSASVTYPAIYALASTATAIYAGGEFTSIGTAVPWRFSAINRSTGAATAGPPTTSPSATATAGDGQATVSWAASPNTTSYTVTSVPAGGSCTTTTTSCVVTGLTNGTAYTFAVTSSNAGVYTSAAALTAAVVPTGAPVDASPPPPATAAATSQPPAATSRPTAAPDRSVRVTLTVVERRDGIPVSANGAVAVTLRCPATTGTCIMRGSLWTPARRTERLSRFAGVRVRAGQRRVVILTLPAATLASLQAAGIRRVPAILAIESTGAARGGDAQRVTLRIPSASRVPSVTG